MIEGFSRSYSLDCWLNNDATLTGDPPGPFDKKKTAELRNPVQIFTFIDEHEQSIDEGSIIVTHPEAVETRDIPNNWLKMPSDRHNQGASVAFADGHAMPWHWRSPKRYKVFNQPAVPPATCKTFGRCKSGFRGNKKPTWRVDIRHLHNRSFHGKPVQN